MGDTRDLYRTDFHAWTGEQAAALRTLLLERPNLPIDLEHLIEEVEDLGSELLHKVESLTQLIIQHLLLLEHSPAIEQRNHWQDEIDSFRSQLRRRLSKSLRRRLEAQMDDRPTFDAAKFKTTTRAQWQAAANARRRRPFPS